MHWVAADAGPIMIRKKRQCYHVNFYVNINIGFERSRLGGHDLWQKVPSSPVTRNRLTRRFVRYASDFISCKREHRKHETQLLERTTNYVSTYSTYSIQKKGLP